MKLDEKKAKQITEVIKQIKFDLEHDQTESLEVLLENIEMIDLISYMPEIGGEL